MRQPSYSGSNAQGVKPLNMLSIDSRRHIVGRPVRTRFGVGDQFIDHAAGLPLRARRRSNAVSPPGMMAPYAPVASLDAVAPSPRDWDEEAASLHDSRLLQQRLHANEAPVDLPLRSKTRMYVMVGALVVGFLGMIIGVFFAGSSATTVPAAGPEAPAQTAPAANQ